MKCSPWEGQQIEKEAWKHRNLCWWRRVDGTALGMGAFSGTWQPFILCFLFALPPSTAQILLHGRWKSCERRERGKEWGGRPAAQGSPTETPTAWAHDPKRHLPMRGILLQHWGSLGWTRAGNSLGTAWPSTHAAVVGDPHSPPLSAAGLSKMQVARVRSCHTVHIAAS